MQQELKITVECECGEGLHWSFFRRNNTVGDDEITLTVDKHECGEAS